MDAAARKSVPAVIENTPKAFGELRDSVHTASSPTRITVTAPHAAAVEIGSRPHVVPIDDLVRWVKLRGMQGLTKGGRVRRSIGNPGKVGPTTAQQAITVAAQLRSLEKNGALSIDAAEQVARRIQAAIAKAGTAPHWYVRKSLPQIEADLNDMISRVQWQ